MNDICLADLLYEIERKRLERSLGPMVMLRNYEGLPERKPGNDVDLIVHPSELIRWRSALAAAADELGIEVNKTLRDYYFESHVFVQGKFEIVKIDLNFAFVWRGVEFADIDRILDEVKVYSAPIYISSLACDRAFVTFCHSFLYGGFIKRRYLSEFSEQLRQGPEFASRLARVFGSGNARTLMDWILSGHSDIPRGKANAMRLSALVRALIRSPIFTLKGLVKSLRGPVSEPK